MKVKIFTEGGSNIGLGHLSRCSSLYDEIVSRGVEAEFIVYSNIENIDFLENRNASIVNWLNTEYLANSIKSTEFCIVDSYLASKVMYQIISEKAIGVVFIDDIGRIKYPKGIIVNPSIIDDGIEYPLTEMNVYLLGAKYVILRNPFVKIERSGLNQNVNKVLITMGGTDFKDLTPKIMSTLCSKYSKIQFDVIIGSTFHNIDFIEKFKLKNIKLHYNVNAIVMKNLMMESDFVISAAGQTLYELLATQTPFIPIQVIDNQDNNVKGLRRFNPNQVIISCEHIDFSGELEEIFDLMLEYRYREIFNNQYKGIIDGLGSKRIIDELLRRLEAK